MLTLSETLQLLQALQPATRPVENVPLQAARGRISAQPVLAGHALPPFDNSAMDGYALAVLDTETVRYRLAGALAAGSSEGLQLQPGQACRIFTGAPLPAGCKSVIAQENVQVEGSDILCKEKPKPGQHMRLVGSELASGKQLLEAGEKIRPLYIGLLAAQGITTLQVYSPLRVGVLSTGNELQQPGQPLQSGQIYDANRPQLLALLSTCGFSALDLGKVPDDATATRELLQTAATQCDVIISTGGASVGDADHVRQVVSQLGSIKHWKVAIKPGKPFAFGRVESKPFFALPGNPAAAVITFLLIALPWLHHAAGAHFVPFKSSVLPLAQAVANHDTRTLYLRGIYRDKDSQSLQLEPLAEQSSAALISLAQAQVLIEVPPQAELYPGELVCYHDLAQMLS